MIRFEWDPAKARTNHRKHGVTFEDAMHVFDLLLVAHTVRDEGQDEIVRLISARQATRKERNRYDETRAQNAV